MTEATAAKAPPTPAVVAAAAFAKATAKAAGREANAGKGSKGAPPRDAGVEVEQSVEMVVQQQLSAA